MNIWQWLPFGKVPEVNVQDLNTQTEQVQIVDVRTRAEFEQSHIKGAQNLPITQFNNQSIIGLQLDPLKPVVTICLSAHRSIPATRKLTRMGYDVQQLKGGMRSWWQQDMPCVKDK